MIAFTLEKGKNALFYITRIYLDSDKNKVLDSMHKFDVFPETLKTTEKKLEPFDDHDFGSIQNSARGAHLINTPLLSCTDN